MQTLDKITVKWQEDGSALAMARACAKDATGAATGISGEGYWLKQADVSSIAGYVYDINSTTPDTPTATLTVTVSSAILNTPDATGILWDLDDVGYNFTYNIAGTNFPTGGHQYEVKFAFTLTGGDTFNLTYSGIAVPVRGQ